MKVKATIELGVTIQNVEIDIPNEYIKKNSNDTYKAITNFVNVFLLKDMKITWEEVI